MAEAKSKTGNRARTKVVAKRSQSGAKVDGMTLHPDTGSLAGGFAATKATSTAVECIVSGIETIFRPIAKELIKGGIVVADSVSEFASETGEQFKDLLAEAKSELEKSQTQGPETKKTEGRTVIKD
ncbi:MAG: DUF5132 domain-containing protein [Pyrinomonadaceae bacterium]|nr:DUF5132 domain-containing protein [Pyrinomonadaceae bacterium]